ncbi:MAG: N-acetylmuramoyl-L-alanine amidase CwlD [Bacilli bacterium]
MESKLIRLCNFVFLIVIALSSVAAIVTTNSVIENKVIYIDPGHGGPDGGAVGIDGIFEKDIVLSISKKLKRYLNEAGYEVLMIRDGDYDLADDNSKNKKREDIHNRVKLINDSNCLLYISIHANKYSSPKIYGSQVFYKPNDELSKVLSEEIQDALKSILQNTKRDAKSISGKYLIDHAKVPGALVEVGFLSNPKEAEELVSDYYQEQMAYAIYVGVLSYLEKINN